VHYARAAMAEWLVLLVLVPAIVAPVVMLIGFAGCYHDVQLQNPPAIQSAVAKSVCVITLTWQYGGAQPQTFQIVRTNPDGTTTTLQTTTSTFDDTGLLAASTYSYTVAAVYGSGPGTASNPVTATTPPFQPTFQETLNADNAGWEGYTLVQRIEAARLTTGGTQVRLTLQASSTEAVSVDRIYISQPSSAAGANPYDSGADLTPIYAGGPTMPLVMAAGQVMLFPAVDQTGINYTLDPTQPLLIAVDFSAAPGSGLGFVQSVPAVEATAFFNLGAEAAVMNRSANYTLVNEILFFQKIEVG
jgi:hypothetical protein